MSLRLAILGRPNVGKSTLFNRLVGKRLALVDDRPGVTRDRREGEGRLSDLSFTVIDTAGLEEAESGTLEARMRQQTERAAELADVILFLIDGRVGVTPMDEHFANWLRQSGKPVILMVNKCEGKAGDSGYLDAFSLGLGDPLKFSAEHGEGLSDLYDALREHADRLDTGPAEEAEPIIQLAVIGRPNAGKSTLVNALIGEQRMLVGPEAGITRDSVSVEWQVDDQIIRLVDTAGLRRKAKVTDKLEKLSVADALRAMQYAQVVLIVIDATSPLDKQDKVLADLVAREGRAPIIVLNKWDLVDNKTELKREIEDLLDFGLSEMRGVPVLTVSALRGKGLETILPAVREVYEAWNTHISTSALNRWLGQATSAHPPPAPSGRRIKLRYISQPKTRPPTFVASCNRPEALPDSYKRYLINALREDFDLWGTPIRLRLKKGDNPYA